MKPVGWKYLATASARFSRLSSAIF